MCNIFSLIHTKKVVTCAHELPAMRPANAAQTLNRPVLQREVPHLRLAQGSSSHSQARKAQKDRTDNHIPAMSATQNYPKCRTCRYCVLLGSRHLPPGKPDSYCSKIESTGADNAWLWDSDEGCDTLYVAQDHFGCLLHSELETDQPENKEAAPAT